MEIKCKLRSLLLDIGLDITHANNSWLWRRKKILSSYDIDTVLDIGANSGQFARQMRYCIGYSKKIISFEPQSSVFEILKKASKNDKNWDVFNMALGDVNEKMKINISENTGCSSYRTLILH